MPDTSEIAIVILNWNGRHYLEKFLPSVVAHSGNANIIVADNASTDDSVDFLKNNYPSVGIILNRENGGFAKGYNDALQNVDAKFYVLLNSDIEVSDNWLQPMIETMNDPNVAGCQPKVRSFHNKSMLEHAGACGGFIDRNYFPFCRGRIFETIEKDEGQYDYPVEVFWATGACLMIRSEIFHRIGGFDESFFAHMEEIDLCWRIKKINHRFMVNPASVVYHVGGGTLPYSSPRKTYLNFRNSLYMIIKNHEGPLFPKLLTRMCIDGVGALRFIFKAEFRQFSAVFNAHMNTYRNLGTLLRKRKEVKKNSTTFNPAGLYQGNILWNYYVKGVKYYSDLNQRLFR